MGMRFAIVEDGERVAARVGDTELWVNGTDAAGRPVPARTSPVDLLPIAMLMAAEAGATLEVDQPLSRATLVRLNAEFGPFAQRYYDLPICPEVRAERAPEPETVPPAAAGIGLMFSGGVDSSYSLTWLADRGIKPTHFINIHAGAHDDNSVTWANRLSRVRQLAEERGVDLLVLETNFHRAWPRSHIQSHAIRNIAAVLPFRWLLGAVYYSSSYPYSELSFAHARARGISFVEPAFFRALAPTGFDLAMIGLGVDRIDKTFAIAGDPMVARHLDVCMDQEYQAGRAETAAINCGRCLKCVRTLATLDATGHLPAFGHAFDLAAWQRDRAEWIDWLVRNGNASAKADLRRLGYDVPAAPASVRGEAAYETSPHGHADETGALRAELAAIRASRSFRVGNALARAYRRLRGRPLD